MDCREFLDALDALIDGELDDIAQARMYTHARECASCSQELRRAKAIREVMLEMDPAIAPPLPAQAAWRNAVRAEAKRRRWRGWYRAISAAAAAFVLLAGTTAVFRQAGVLNFDGGTEGATILATTASPVEYYGARRNYGPGDSMGEAVLVEADGEAGSTPMIAGDAAAIPQATGVSSAAAPQRIGDLEDSGAREKRLEIQSATREMYSEDFDSALSAISDLAEEYNASFAGNALQTEGGIRKAVMAIDVPAEDLNAFLEAVDYVGQVTFADLRAEDISDHYYDAQGRLDALGLEKARLLELIPEAGNSEEIAALQAQLEDVYQQMDTLEGKIRGFDAQLRYARVDLMLNEGAPGTAAQTGGKDTGGEVREGFSRSLSSLRDFFSDMAVSLAVIAPYAGLALALVAVVWIVVALIKRRKRG